MPSWSRPARPREVFERILGLLADRRMDAYVDHFAEDGVLGLPFAPPGVPRRIEGREAIRAFVRAGVDRLGEASPRWRFESAEVHETLDPDVIVTEFEVHGVHGGQPYRFVNLQVMTVHDGEIVSLRDYWNPLDRPELAALAGTSPPAT